MKKRYIIFLALIILIITNYLLLNHQLLFKICAQEKIDNSSIGKMLNSARENYYKGKVEDAIDIYKQILIINPNHLETLKNLLFITSETGDFKSALTYNEKIMELAPDDLYWSFRQGMLLYQMGDYQNSKALLQEILNNESTLTANQKALFYYYLADLYLVADDLEEAIYYFQQGINTAPQITLNYLGQAEAFKKKGDIEKAILAYQEALKKDSSLAFIYPVMAALYEELEKDSEAFYYWKRSIATNNQKELAIRKVDLLTSKHPELVEAETRQKEESRKNIEWVYVEPLSEAEVIPLVRIGLTTNVNAVSFQAGSPFLIKNKQDNTVYFEGEEKVEYKLTYRNKVFQIYQNEKLITKIDATVPLLVELINRRASFVIYNINYGSGYFWAGTEDRQYRGLLELYPINNNLFNVINIVNLEEYLFSVVPAEMPAWWPLEALKAQAIAARSYALSHLGRHSQEGYDLCASVHCAVYNGIKSENSRTNRAVLETRGEVAEYNKRIIDAVFSSNTGGYSESSLDVWGHQLGYLQGVSSMLDDKYDFPLEPYKLEEWLINEPPSFSANRKYAGINIYRWTRLLDADYLQDRYQLNKITEIKPLGRSQGGSVNQILIKGEDREIIFKRDSIRSALGGLKSNRFILYPIYNNKGFIEKVIFYGAGWGHNVGMDQSGAAGMAELGYPYEKIIQHYYPGVVINKRY